MSGLVDGVWQSRWDPSDHDGDGRFLRKPTRFRDPELPGPAVPGRYHLFVAWTCPWAHRTLLVRALKGLQDRIGVHFANDLSDRSWRFVQPTDSPHGHSWLYELYQRADPAYTGRVTVPVLWDAVEERILNNESSEIMRILDRLPSDAPPLAPPGLLSEIDAMNERLYHSLNNGVYRAGFATTQDAYDEAVTGVFSTLDAMESHLQGREWLVADQLTESDLRLFVTLFRFDSAYHTLFRCNLRRVADYPNLRAHTQRIWELPGVSQTGNIEEAKRGYASIRAVNPHRIVPAGPLRPW